MIRNKISLFVICAALATQGQVLCRWTADSSRTTPIEFSCFRGESLLLSPTLTSYGKPITNYTGTLLWQTNGMGTAWWSTNVLAFTPAMDVGATRYTIFIRAAMTNGVNYRANGTITMRNAPGFTPNTLPLPVPSIDFATVTPTNAPWLLAELDPGIPDAIATAVAISGTNAQDMADIALVLARDYALTNQVTKLWSNDRFVDGLGNSYIVSNFWTMTFSDDFADSLGGVPDQASYAGEYGTDVSETHGPYDWWTFGNNETGFYVNRRSGVGTYSNWKATTNQYVLDVFTTGNGKAFISHTATTNLIGTFALEDSVTAGLATKVSTNDATYLAPCPKRIPRYSQMQSPTQTIGTLPSDGETTQGFTV
jgi:hypothetical protein